MGESEYFCWGLNKLNFRGLSWQWRDVYIRLTPSHMADHSTLQTQDKNTNIKLLTPIDISVPSYMQTVAPSCGFPLSVVSNMCVFNADYHNCHQSNITNFLCEKWHAWPLKTENCHDANFVITGGTGGCHYDNLQCHQWWQSWHHDCSWFSVSCCFILSLEALESWPMVVKIQMWKFHQNLLLGYVTEFNSSPLSAIYMHQWIMWALVQIMACRLFSTKSLSKPILGYC